MDVNSSWAQAIAGSVLFGPAPFTYGSQAAIVGYSSSVYHFIHSMGIVYR